MSGLRLFVGLVFVGCARAQGPALSDTLIGLELPLLASPSLRLAVEGQVFSTPAEIVIDVGSPISLVTTACIDAPLVRAERVKVLDPVGAPDTFPVTRLAGVTVGGRRLVPRDAGLVAGSSCVVVLGLDRLETTALVVDAAKRRVHFVASRSKREWLELAAQQHGDVQVLELSRDPVTDWPLLAARLTQGAAQLTGPFVFSTRERVTRVFERRLAIEGFTSTADLVERLQLPPEKVPLELASFTGAPLDALEFAPGVAANGLMVLSLPGEPTDVVGVIAADAWGRFDATIDVWSGALVLQRPRVYASGARYRCARAGEPTDEGCFELTAVSAPQGVVVTGAVHRPLPEGGRLYLDFPGRSVGCRVGLSFDRGDRGRSTQHVLPWGRLTEAMPACASALRGVKEVALGLFEEGALETCPGLCAFAHELRTGRVSCECQGSPLGLFPSGANGALEQLQRRLERQDPEPADPD